MRLWLAIIAALIFVGSVEHARACPASRDPLVEHVRKVHRKARERDPFVRIVRDLIRRERAGLLVH